jgi:hypothetical protein
MSTCKRLDLRTLGFRPIRPQNLPRPSWKPTLVMQETVGGPRPKSLRQAKSPFGPCTHFFSMEWKNTCIIGVNLLAATFPIPKGWSIMAPGLELEVIPLHSLLEVTSVIGSRLVKRYNIFSNQRQQILANHTKLIGFKVWCYSIYFSPCFQLLPHL